MVAGCVCVVLHSLRQPPERESATRNLLHISSSDVWVHLSLMSTTTLPPRRIVRRDAPRRMHIIIPSVCGAARFGRGAQANEHTGHTERIACKHVERVTMPFSSMFARARFAIVHSVVRKRAVQIDFAYNFHPPRLSTLWHHLCAKRMYTHTHTHTVQFSHGRAFFCHSASRRIGIRLVTRNACLSACVAFVRARSGCVEC